ncbi:CHAT domain-containing protein, partial [Limnospira platensis]|uniref:CHAT domain-containing protein n=1 Tax=Limnospira platensis TaxID=118562 RepID=UPI003DA51FA3
MGYNQGAVARGFTEPTPPNQDSPEAEPCRVGVRDGKIYGGFSTPLYSLPRLREPLTQPLRRYPMNEYLDIWLEILEAKKRGLSGKAVYTIFQKYQDQLDLDFAETLRQWFHSQLDPKKIRKNKDLARNLHNFAINISDFPLGSRANNLEIAILAYQSALEVRTRSAFPEDWATTQNNLGNAYSDRIRGERADNMEEAIRRYEAALEVRTPSSFPLDCLQTGRNLGNLGYDLQNWESAIEGYDNAIRAVEQSRDWATSPDTKRQILEDALPIYGKMIQACLHLERYDQALLTVDRSKSRTLMEMLTSADLVPKNATPQQQDQYRQLNRKIAALQQSFAPTETPEAGEHRGHRDIATATDAPGTPQLKHLLQQRDRLLAQINDPAFNAFQTVRPQLPDFRQLLTPETALIEWYLPQDPNLGAWAFTVTLDQDRPHIDVYCYSADQRQRLDQFNQTYFADYRQASWYQALGDRLDDLTEYLHLSDIIAPLPPTCQRLILIPHLYLHLFPLHALSVDLNAPATPLLERFSQGVSYAPSCQILDYIHHRPPPATPPQFFAVQNPTQDLNYAQMEVEFIRPYFDPNTYILSREAATKSALNRPETLEKLRESHIIHFSCHGGFDSEKPLNSAVILAGYAPLESAPTEEKRQTLTLRDGRRFDTAQQGLTLGEIYRNLEIPACRLVMLS